MERAAITHQSEMSGQDVLRLYAQGYQVMCRYCKIPFITRPEVLGEGETPLYVACGRNPQHFSLLSEPADRMQEMRSRMIARRSEK